MGFQTIVTCDNCGNVVPEKSDYVGIGCTFEIDRNEIGQTDVRRRKGGVFCEECGGTIWEKIAALFPGKP